MTERRRPVRFFRYRIPLDGVLWLDDDTTVMSAEHWAEYDDEGLEVILMEYGPEQDWSPNIQPEVNGGG